MTTAVITGGAIL